jgi:hypothetical protein
LKQPSPDCHVTGNLLVSAVRKKEGLLNLPAVIFVIPQGFS